MSEVWENFSAQALTFKVLVSPLPNKSQSEEKALLRRNIIGKARKHLSIPE